MRRIPCLTLLACFQAVTEHVQSSQPWRFITKSFVYTRSRVVDVVKTTATTPDVMIKV